MTTAVRTHDRITGALLGLATGDALGTTQEFKSNPKPIDDIVGGGAFNLKAGEWTDDTSMALCLAESLVMCNGFDAADQLVRYCAWHDLGHLSSNGRCFDIGGQTSRSLARFKRDGTCFDDNDSTNAGNGSLMRLAPVVMFFRYAPHEAIRWAGESSKTTHAALEAVDACRYFASLLLKAFNGKTRSEILAPPSAQLGLCDRVADVADGGWRKQRKDIKPSGYVVDSLEAALWAFEQAKDFRHGALLAVNLGGDADTIGAIYGQIAGAYFGASGIPESWVAKLAHLDVIKDLALKLDDDE